MPITWKTIGKVSDGAAVGASLLDSAGESINSGLESLKGILTDQQKLEQDNLNQRVKNDTAGYLDALDKLRTSGEVASAQTDGTLDALRQQFGLADADKIRDADDKLLTSLKTSERKDKLNARTDRVNAQTDAETAYAFERTLLEDSRNDEEHKHKKHETDQTRRAKEIMATTYDPTLSELDNRKRGILAMEEAGIEPRFQGIAVDAHISNYKKINALSDAELLQAEADEAAIDAEAEPDVRAYQTTMALAQEGINRLPSYLREGGPTSDGELADAVFEQMNIDPSEAGFLFNIAGETDDGGFVTGEVSAAEVPAFLTKMTAKVQADIDELIKKNPKMEGQLAKQYRLNLNPRALVLDALKATGVVDIENTDDGFQGKLDVVRAEEVIGQALQQALDLVPLKAQYTGEITAAQEGLDGVHQRVATKKLRSQLDRQRSVVVRGRRTTQ